MDGSSEAPADRTKRMSCGIGHGIPAAAVVTVCCRSLTDNSIRVRSRLRNAELI
jgi:hypothetical protein